MVADDGRPSKEEIRSCALALRAGLSGEERTEKSKRIEKFLTGLNEFSAARQVMLYMSFRDEVETTGLLAEVLAEGKRLILPKCYPHGIMQPFAVTDLDRDVEEGRWGITEPKAKGEPVDPQVIDLVVVPGVAFDRQGHRLGYGAGYYDRFLPRLAPGTPRIGLAFSCQRVERIPAEAFDRRVSAVITEDGVFPIKF